MIVVGLVQRRRCRIIDIVKAASKGASPGMVRGTRYYRAWTKWDCKLTTPTTQNKIALDFLDFTFEQQPWWYSFISATTMIPLTAEKAPAVMVVALVDPKGQPKLPIEVQKAW
jgi:hypothetical protein